MSELVKEQNMLVIISNPTPVAGEVAIINSFFEEGLEIMHLRKPCVAVDELRALVEKIKPQYHSQVALHQHHELVTEFGIKRLHFPEEKRKNSKEDELQQLNKNGVRLSTSIHSLATVEKLVACFSYAFFGPVFNSISKKGYIASVTDDIDLSFARQIKLIAIGGIDNHNIEKALSMGFDGVAVLGAVWQKAEPIKKFKQLQQRWKVTGQ